MIMNNPIEISRNLLIIDDEVEITRTLQRQFRRKYNVLKANSAMDAIPIMETENIQVILSDQRMPGMTGIDFFSKIKDKFPDSLKLILTGYSDIGAVIEAINRGQVFRYLTKPWNPVELEVAIQEAFDKFDLVNYNKRLLNELNETNKNLENKVKERTIELEQSNEKLKKINIEKNKYIGIVTHDLRNPIGNAFSFSDLLIADYFELSPEKHIQYLKIINERCEYSLKLIEDFLDAAKIEAGILDLQLKEYNFCEIISQCITQNQLFSQKKAQKVSLNFDSENLMVKVDRDKIEQVINNLISNAIKYSEPNTHIYILLESNNKELTLTVKDEGRGIPEDELASVFNVFQTTSVKATAQEKSTGLGLAIVKKIVHAHNGQIGAKSKVGVGSEFFFTLPLS